MELLTQCGWLDIAFHHATRLGQHEVLTLCAMLLLRAVIRVVGFLFGHKGIPVIDTDNGAVSPVGSTL